MEHRRPKRENLQYSSHCVYHKFWRKQNAGFLMTWLIYLVSYVHDRDIYEFYFSITFTEYQ